MISRVYYIIIIYRCLNSNIFPNIFHCISVTFDTIIIARNKIRIRVIILTIFTGWVATINFNKEKSTTHTIRILIIYRIPKTIGIAIVSQHPLSCRQHHIRRNKSPGRRIVVAGLEVVQPGLRVVHIAPVPERVLCSQGACKRAGAGKQSAPAVVGVFYYRVVAPVNETDDVVLPVTDIVVIRTVEVDGNDISGCIVAEPITLTVPSCSLDKPKPASATLVLPLACAVLFPVPLIAFACLFPALAGCLSWAAMNFQIIFKLTYFGLDF